MRDLELEEDCPGLCNAPYEITSERDPRYNCVAWALGDITHYWYDVAIKGYYWPPGTPSADTLEGWLLVFERHGYHQTDQRELEQEFEKIAIYVGADGCPEHVARQKSSGKWSSKMGRGCDIEHPTLEAVEGSVMGKVAVIMKRRCVNGIRVFESSIQSR